MTCPHCGGRVLPDGDPYDPMLKCLNCGRGAYADGAAPAYMAASA